MTSSARDDLADHNDCDDTEIPMTEAQIRRETKRRRPTEEKAREAVETFLEDVLGNVPDFTLAEDGDATSAPGKCGWAFWVRHTDTTSYIHEDLSIEWYGTSWTAGDSLDSEDNDDCDDTGDR